MTKCYIYLNGRLVTTISLACFPRCNGEAVANRHARQLFKTGKVLAVLAR